MTWARHGPHQLPTGRSPPRHSSQLLTWRRPAARLTDARCVAGQRSNAPPWIGRAHSLLPASLRRASPPRAAPQRERHQFARRQPLSAQERQRLWLAVSPRGGAGCLRVPFFRATTLHLWQPRAQQATGRMGASRCAAGRGTGLAVRDGQSGLTEATRVPFRTAGGGKGISRGVVGGNADGRLGRRHGRVAGGGPAAAGAGAALGRG